MLRLKEVASQSETFPKRVLENTSQPDDCTDGPTGHYREVFSIDRPPLLAVGRILRGNYSAFVLMRIQFMPDVLLNQM